MTIAEDYTKKALATLVKLLDDTDSQVRLQSASLILGYTDGHMNGAVMTSKVPTPEPKENSQP